MRASLALLLLTVVAAAAADNAGPLGTLQQSAARGALDSDLMVEDGMAYGSVKSLREQQRLHEEMIWGFDDAESVTLDSTTVDYNNTSNDTSTDEGITAGGIASIVVVCLVVLAYALALAFHCYREKLWKKC